MSDSKPKKESPTGPASPEAPVRELRPEVGPVQPREWGPEQSRPELTPQAPRPEEPAPRRQAPEVKLPHVDEMPAR